MKLYIFLTILTSVIALTGCQTNSAFDMEDKIDENTTVTKDKTYKYSFYWSSFESNQTDALKNSSKVKAKYYSLMFKPQNNYLRVSSIGGRTSVKAVVKELDKSKVPDIDAIARFKYYEIFIKKQVDSKIKNFISNNKEKIIPLKFKVTANPELLTYETVLEKLKKYFKDVVLKKKKGEDFSISCNFLVSGLTNFKYDDNHISFNLKVVFANVKTEKIDYAAYLDDVEEIIEKNLADKNYKMVTKYNDIYRDIVPQKEKYYRYAYKLHVTTLDYMSALLDLVAMFKEMDDEKIEDEALDTFSELYKEKAEYKIRKKVGKKLYYLKKKYRSGKTKKDGVIEALKSIIIEYPIEN